MRIVRFTALPENTIFRRPAASDASGASAVAEVNLPVLDNDRNETLPLGVFKHSLHGGAICQDVQVFELYLIASIVLTGLCRVGSGVFPKYEHFFLHAASRD